MRETVTDGVVQKRLAHSKVVFLEESGLLVDTGPETEWEDLESFVESFDGVERVFLSHAHGDHFGNVERVQSRFDIEVSCPAVEPLDDVPIDPETVTRIDDGEYVTPGVRMLSIPGHTPGIAALHLEDEEVLLGTDVLDGSDRRGLPAGYLLPPPDRYNWDAAKAELNLERLLDLSFDTVVVTHGSNVVDDPKGKLERYLNFPDHYRQDLLESLE